MAATAEKPATGWTYEAYYRLDDEQRYEIIAGTLLVAPAPDIPHQRWIMELGVRLRDFVRKKRVGEIFIAPVDVVLDSENVVQPDLVFVGRENARLVQRRGIFGSPDLVVEVISPFTVRRDRYEKRELYARFGIKEYWLADPANGSVEILA